MSVDTQTHLTPLAARFREAMAAHTEANKAYRELNHIADSANRAALNAQSSLGRALQELERMAVTNPTEDALELAAARVVDEEWKAKRAAQLLVAAQAAQTDASKILRESQLKLNAAREALHAEALHE